MIVPPRYRDRTFDTFDPTVSKSAQVALEAAKQAVEQRTSLALIGRPGAGKTHLAAAIGNAVRFGEWCNVTDLIGAIRQDIRIGENDGHRLAADLAKEEGFVVLDDLGREKVTEFTGEVLYRLINRRYEHKRPTIVTSNCSMAELEANGYGPVISRLSEEGRIVQMASATDYRTRKP